MGLKVELSGQGQFLFLCDAADGHVGPLTIIGPQPMRGEILDLVDRIEQAMRLPVIAHGTVVTLDTGVLLWMSRLNEFKRDAALICPFHHCYAWKSEGNSEIN